MTDLPRRWFTSGSCDALWPGDGTYNDVPFDALPPLEGPLDGSFAWLAAQAEPKGGMTYEQMPVDAEVKRVAHLTAEAERAGLRVPDAFVRFMTDPALYARVRSCTACYWDLTSRLIPLPGDNGPRRLLRFLNDQQTCLLWYLLLEPDGAHAVACAAPEWRDESAEDLEDAAEPRGVSLCANSFEEFIKRFWLENEIWFESIAEQSLAPELRAYSEAARNARGAR